MKIPMTAADRVPAVEITKALIPNPYPGKDFLTQEEALDLVSRVAGMLTIETRRQKRVYGGTR